MIRSRFALRSGPPVAKFVIAMGAALVLACNGDPSSPGDAVALRLVAARSSGTDITVTAAQPDSATQDTTLDVTVSGSGFAPGAVAEWALSGVTDPSQVRTNSTAYVSSRKLIANITISAAATVGKWDVKVTSGPKTGIGGELFTVKVKGNVDTDSRANYVIANQVNVAASGQPENWQPAGIQGDGRLRDGVGANGANSEYQGEFCGVGARITNGDRETGDLSYDPDNLFTSSTACGSARYYKFYLNGAGSTPTPLGPLSRVLGIWALAVGQTINKGQGFGVELPNCGVLMFNSQYGGDDLLVTRTDNGTGPRTWRVRSQGSHMAACVNQVKQGALTYKATGVKYYLPFSITVTEVPYPYPKFP